MNIYSNRIKNINYQNYLYKNNAYNFNIKDAEVFLEFEIYHINKNLKINNQLFNPKITKKLLKKIKRIKKYYSRFIKEDHKEKLKNFLEAIKINTQKEEDFDEKLISFMIIANEEIYSQTPRVIQIICLLFYLEGYKEKYNLILEVLTGEGKTLTISFLALYLAVIGNKVDILTSSPILAQRDSKERKEFYNLFGISCDFCKLDSKNDANLFGGKEKQFECYKANIVYGDGTSLIGDILRSEFMEKKGRGNRPFDYIIIDEIDNICIDNLRNIVELIDNFPGYKYLEYMYLFIYKELSNKINNMKNKFGKNFEEKLKEKAQFILHDISTEARKFLYHNKHLKYDDKDKVLLPENCFEFIDLRIDHWCKMAFDAMFNFKLNQNYFISEDENFKFKTIKPIDYENTGVILKNSIWSGLHQFLQIKEGLTFTEENINSSFMSYLSFFKKYKIINGITGTLGSKKTQQALNIIYKINLLRMPPFKQRALQIYEPKVFSEKKLYQQNLINEIIEFSAHFKRVVLVIFEYMSQVVEMHKYLDSHRKDFKLEDTEIISYFRSDIENKFLERQMKPNTVIISTNLSGRGTDIKINSEVKKNGGLHVIITFMPYNERIEKQAQGRAGRCGDKGSSITMILAQNNYETLKKRRNKYEIEQFKFLIHLYVPQSDLNQRFFEEFCQKFHQIKNTNKDISKEIIADLKEKWSMFIFKNNINTFMNDSISPKVAGQVYRLYESIVTGNFKDLMKEIDIDDIENYKFYNPFNQLRSNLSDEMHQSAIEKNPGFSIGAYYNQAYSSIVDKRKGYQMLVYNNLSILYKICQKFIFQYRECIDMFKEIHKNNNNYSYCFIKQFEDKQTIMNLFLKNIKKNLNIIENMDAFQDNKKSDFLRKYSTKCERLEINISNKFHLDIMITEIGLPKNVIDYFSDFGIDFFFEIDCLEKPCYIF
jgi:preprotein translocase subunit SecA